MAQTAAQESSRSERSDINSRRNQQEKHCVSDSSSRSNGQPASIIKRRHHNDETQQAEAVEKLNGGRAQVPSVPHWVPRQGGRLQGNVFEDAQEMHKQTSPRGRQVIPRVVDCAKIHPSAGAMETALDQRAYTFEHGSYSILPDHEKPFVSCRRMSTLTTLPQNAGGTTQMDRKPSIRLRENSEARLRKLLPKEPSKDDIRAQYAHSVAEKHDGNFLEAMIRNNFPVPRGPKVDNQFPPIHTRQTANKYDSHLPFGPTASQVPLPVLPRSGRRHQHEPPPGPSVDDRSSVGGGKKLIARGHESDRGAAGWTIISGGGEMVLF
jgi:hypothetical protein